MRRHASATLGLTLRVTLALAAATAARAVTLPPGFVAETLLTGLDRPTVIAFAPGDRVFVALKSGRVRLMVSGAIQPDDFADISAQVNEYWDRGLMGIAIHPRYPEVPHVWLLFVHDPPGVEPDGGGERVCRLIRLTARPDDPNRALEGSEVVILGKASTREHVGDEDDGSIGRPPSCAAGSGYVRDCLPSDSPSHAVGTCAFAPDGSMFVGIGDGAHFAGVDSRALRAQSPSSLSGKILRIDPDTGLGLPDNPFFDGDPASNASRVWALGLRNPFRFVVDAATGAPWIGDVGWNSWEEIDAGRGANFGWPCYEGDDSGSERQAAYQLGASTFLACRSLYQRGAGAVAAPVHAYPRTAGGAAIIGGPAWRRASWPEPHRDVLFFGDYNGNWIRQMDLPPAPPAVRDFATGLSPAGGPVQLVEGPGDRLCAVLFDGATSTITCYRHVGDDRAPVAVASASPVAGPLPLVVDFSSEGSSDEDGDPLTFRWDFGDGASADGPSARHAYTTAGARTARLTVSDGRGLQAFDEVAILAGDALPEPAIDRPEAGATWAVGDAIALSGRAHDPEDGALSGESLRWEVRVRHAQHVHFDAFAATGSSAVMTAPDHGDDASLLACLTATDSAGAVATTCRELLPRTIGVSLWSEPPGVPVAFGPTAWVTPAQVTATARSQRDLAAPPFFGALRFGSWSDGGDRARRIALGDDAVSLRADYEPRGCEPGDVHPDGVGDGRASLADLVLLRRKMLGLEPASPRDVTCGDLHPGSIACAGVPSSWCATGDASIALGDLVELRRVIVGRDRIACGPCEQ